MTSKASSYTLKCLFSKPESVGRALALSSDMRPHFILGSRGVGLLALSAQATLRAGRAPAQGHCAQCYTWESPPELSSKPA